MVQEISFTGNSQNYCICFIDIVDSTRNTVNIDAEKVKRYYSVFINVMAAIARDFNSNIIKNTGDSLMYYFPETSDSTKVSAFKGVLECGLTMIAVNPIINAKLNEEELPSIEYRISADYGRVDVAKSLTSTSEDLFGPAINICAKINSFASPNSMVIGRDLYKIVKHTLDKKYSFNKVGEYLIGDTGVQYSVYSISSKSKTSNAETLRLYKNIPEINSELGKNRSMSNKTSKKKFGIYSPCSREFIFLVKAPNSTGFLIKQSDSFKFGNNSLNLV